MESNVLYLVPPWSTSTALAPPTSVTSEMRALSVLRDSREEEPEPGLDRELDILGNLPNDDW